MAEAMPLLEAEGLALAAGGRVLVHGLDLRPRPGELWAVLGPNGAGKTTLLHVLAGLRRPAAGGVRVGGRPVGALPRRRLARLVGLLPQEEEPGLPATALELALLGRLPHRPPWRGETAADLAAARAALAAVGLAGLEERLLATLSGGERRRAALAALLAQDPAVWLLDEPAAHLDLPHQVAVMRLLRARAHEGRAVLATLHDPNLAVRWCTHALALMPGGEPFAGPAREVLTAERLGALYGHPLETARTASGPVFVPRP